MEEKIQVSVYCLVYNHAKFLKKCLDGFVNQKTNFRFKVIIHDDCSTDGSQNIIKEYMEKYPDIFEPIFQNENQHSKGVPILKNYIMPRICGEYVAMCEGDDYWCDDYKLQKQYDYMKTHPECALCTHNTVIHDLSGKTPDRNFNSWTVPHELSEDEIFFGWNVHTSSYFIKRNCLDEPEWKKKYWSGDYKKLVIAKANGTVVCLPDVMSVYNYGNLNGATMQNINSSVDILIKKEAARIDFLMEYNEYTQYRFDTVVKKRIKNVDFLCTRLKSDEIIKNSNDFNKIKEAAQKVSEHPYFGTYISGKNKLYKKIGLIIKYKGYVIEPVWRVGIRILRKGHI